MQTGVISLSQYEWTIDGICDSQKSSLKTKFHNSTVNHDLQILPPLWCPDKLR